MAGNTNGSPDIKLLFGVLGGGSLSGASGTEIKRDLSKIVKRLNEKPLRIKIGLETNDSKKLWQQQLKDKLKALGENENFTVKVSKIDCSSAIAGFKQQLNAVVNSISIEKGMSITLKSKDIGEIVSNTKDASTAASNAKQKYSELDAVLKEVKRTNDALGGSYQSVVKGFGASPEEVSNMEALRQKFVELDTATGKLRENRNNATQEDINNIYRLQNELRGLIDLNKRQQEVSANSGESARMATLTEVINAYNKIDKYIQKNPKILKTDQGAGLVNIRGQLRAVIDEATRAKSALGSVGDEADNNYYATTLSKEDLRQRMDDVLNYQRELRSAGKEGNTLIGAIKSAYQKFGGWMFITRSLTQAIRILKQMVINVKEIDAAMTELKKVTDETDQAYAKFLDNASVRAKRVGASLTDTINATADFARLGYDMSEASAIADAALIYKNIGDGIADISTASESIISTMRAFGVEATDVMIIVDRFNEVGNSFPISSKGVGDALLNSASALAAARNKLDESIAMITAANSVIQDPEKVGTALKTVSMYLRAAKTEAEEAGESTDGMANSVSALRQELLRLTGNKVDIQLDENTFKSTYQILKELSEVWTDLTDVSRANILEQIGGKRNSNVVSALLANFDMAEDVIATAASSSGSALEENKKQLDSINGKLSQFNLAFETLSANVVNSGVIKFFIDLGTNILNLLNLLQQVNLLLPLIIASIATIRYFQLAKQAQEAAVQINALVNRFVAEKTATDSLVTSYLALTNAQRQEVLTKLQAQVASGALTKAQYAEITAKLGLTAATKGAKTATDALNISIKALMKSNPAGWILSIISLVPMAISLFSSLETSVETAEENYKKLQEESKADREKLETLNDLIEKYKDLRSALSKKWSEEQVTGILEVQEEIVKLTGKQAENLDLVNGKLDEEYKKLLGIYSISAQDALESAESEYLIAKEKLDKGYVPDETFYGTSKEDEHNAFFFVQRAFEELFPEKVKEYEEQTDLLYSFWHSVYWREETGSSAGEIADALGNLGSYEAGLEKLKEWRNLIQEATKLGGAYGYAGEAYEVGDALSFLNSKIVEFEGVINEADAAKERFYSAKATAEVIDYLYSNTIATQEAFSSYVENVLNTVSDKDYANALVKAMHLMLPDFKLPDEIERDLSLYNEVVANALSNFKNITSELNLAIDEFNQNGFVSIDTYRKIMMLGESVKEDFGDIFTATSNGFSISADELSALVEELEQQYAATLVANGASQDQIAILFALSTKFDELSESAEDALSDIKEFSSIIEEMNSGTEFSTFEILELIDKYPELIECIGETANGYVIETDKLRKLNAERIKGLRLQEEERLQKARDALERNSRNISTVHMVEGIFNENEVDSFEDFITGWEKKFNQSADGVKWVDGIEEFIDALIRARTYLGILDDYDEGIVGKSGIAGTTTESEFERQYNYHQHLLAMEQETTEEYLDWLESAYRTAYNSNQITLDDFRKYEEELYEGRKTLLSEYIGDKEHNILLLRNSDADSARIVQEYKDIQSRLHAEAEYYRSLGLDENSDYIQELQSQWLDYQELINDIRREDFNAQLDTRKFEIDMLSADGNNSEKIIDSWKSILEDIDSEIEYYTSLGYDTSDEVVRNLLDNAQEAKAGIISAIEDVVATVNDVVDGFEEAYTALTDAAKEYASTGYISVDSLQSILELSPKYLAYLYDENGQLVLNEKALQRVIAAKTEEMAAETALAYAKQVLNAVEQNEIITLESLTRAEVASSNATWDMAYATLGLAKAIGVAKGMDMGYFDDAVSYISKIQSITKTATDSISAYYRTLENGYISQADALDQILSLTQDLIKWENEQDISALEKELEKYQEIVEKKKEMLQLAKEENDHEESIAEKLEEIAKLQSRIDQLSLDDSREAKAQKNQLEEDLRDLQKGLADEQSEYAYNAQVETLDRELEAYEENLNDQITELENMLDSAEELYQAAISRIENNWDDLYDQLLKWNRDYGSTLESDLISAWDAASVAVQRYGGFVAALDGAQNHTNLGGGSYIVTPENTNEQIARSIVNVMKKNSASWTASTTDSERADLANRNEELAKVLEGYINKKVIRTPDGVWWVGNQKLYDVYHTGGIVGNHPTLKQQEVMAVLENGEAVLDEKREEGLYRLVDFAQVLSERFGKVINADGFGKFFGNNISLPNASALTPIGDTNNSNLTINPVVNVTINHNGHITEDDARRFGSIAAQSTLKELEDAFTRRGVSNIGSAMLKH